MTETTAARKGRPPAYSNDVAVSVRQRSAAGESARSIYLSLQANPPTGYSRGPAYATILDMCHGRGGYPRLASEQ